MALEAEEALPTVAMAGPTEAEVATEHRQEDTEEHLAMALQTCISRPRTVVATHSRSLDMACLRKVFQNQTDAIVVACLFMLVTC